MFRKQKVCKQDICKPGQKNRTKLHKFTLNEPERPPRENALENSVVLKTLFGYLDGKDLRSCRLVQSAWNPEAVSALKKNSKHVKIYSFRFNSSRMLEFMDCVQSSQDFPFTKIYLGSNDEPFPVVIWNVLLRFIAPWVTSLRTSVSPSVLSLPTGIKFPNLAELDILYGNHSFVVDLVTNAPNLTSLTIWMPEKRTLQLLGKISTLNLSKFCLWGYESNGVYLKEVEKFLKSQEETLTDFTVHSFTATKEPGFRVVPMKHLKTLTLQSFYSYWKPVQAGKLYPDLTTFKMSSDRGKLTRDDFMNLTNGQPLTSVKTVEFSSALSHTSIMMHEIVPLLFPNVKCLKIPTSVNNLLFVFENLKNLTEVEFLNIYLNCSLRGLMYQLTGISTFRRVESSEFSKQDILNIIKVFGTRLTKSPYSALQKIQRVKLHCRLGEQDYCELICRVVIFQMKNLNQLHINVSHGEKSQQQCFSLLSKGMKGIVKVMRKKFVVIVS